MTASIYFEYRLAKGDYRRMLYFNTFGVKRFQGAFVALAWAGAFLLLLLEWLGRVEPTRVTHICCLVVSVCVPALLADVEYRIHAFGRDHCGDKAVLRKMIFTGEGIRYSNQGDKESHFERWEDLLRVFERKDQFLIYRDARQVTILPKSAVSAPALEDLRGLLREKLGEYYILRN